MTRKLDRTEIARIARFVEPQAPVTAPAHPPRTFELPTRLYALTVGSYLAFLGVMAAGFRSGALLIPMAIFVAYIVMAFGVPALWAGMQPENDARALSWVQFRRDGVMTATGRLDAAQASVQVLILPVLILFWGVAAVVIAALV